MQSDFPAKLNLPLSRLNRPVLPSVDSFEADLCPVSPSDSLPKQIREVLLRRDRLLVELMTQQGDIWREMETLEREIEGRIRRRRIGAK